MFPQIIAGVNKSKTKMADESSSDEGIDVQNGYDGEPDIFLPGGSESDTSDSAGNCPLKNVEECFCDMLCFLQAQLCS